MKLFSPLRTSFIPFLNVIKTLSMYIMRIGPCIILIPLVVVQPTLGYHIANRQSRYITSARLKSAYTTQQYSLAPEDGRINV